MAGAGAFAGALFFLGRGSSSAYTAYGSSGLGYKSFLGALLWLSALIALAATGASLHHEFSQEYEGEVYKFKPFNISVVKYQVAADVIVWIGVTVFAALDFLDKGVDKVVLMAVEGVMAILTFAAAIATTSKFAGKEDYCKYSISSKKNCTTYQASIFFTWLLTFLLFAKVVFSNSLKSDGGRSKV